MAIRAGWAVIAAKKQPARGPRRAGAVLLALTVEERETLRAAAAREGLGLGPWLRMLGLREAGRDRGVTPGRFPAVGGGRGSRYSRGK
jgi:hypothetical protein